MSAFCVLIAAALLSETPNSPPKEKDTDEASAIAKLELLGGKIERDESVDPAAVTAIRFKPNSKFHDKYIHSLSPFRSLSTLDLVGTRVTKGALKELAQFDRLTFLAVPGPEFEIDDEALRHLQNMKNLKTLILWNRSIDDDRLRQIRSELPEVCVLNKSSSCSGSGYVAGRQFLVMTDGNSLKLTASKDRLTVTDPDFEFVAEHDQVSTNEPRRIAIPVDAKRVRIIHARGFVRIFADDKPLSSFRHAPAP